MPLLRFRLDIRLITNLVFRCRNPVADEIAPIASAVAPVTYARLVLASADESRNVIPAGRFAESANKLLVFLGHSSERDRGTVSLRLHIKPESRCSCRTTDCLQNLRKTCRLEEYHTLCVRRCENIYVLGNAHTYRGGYRVNQHVVADHPLQHLLLMRAKILPILDAQPQ